MFSTILILAVSRRAALRSFPNASTPYAHTGVESWLEAPLCSFVLLAYMSGVKCQNRNLVSGYTLLGREVLETSLFFTFFHCPTYSSVGNYQN